MGSEESSHVTRLDKSEKEKTVEGHIARAQTLRQTFADIFPPPKKTEINK